MPEWADGRQLECEHCGRRGIGYEVCDCGYKMVSVMADDERRAEIEAARDGLQRILNMPCPFDRESDPLADAQRIASETITKLNQLGRVRDARGDDDVARLRAAAKRVLEADMRGVRDIDALNALEDAAGFWQQGQRRSPQDEDHEREPSYEVGVALDAFWQVRDETQDNVQAMRAALAAARSPQGEDARGDDEAAREPMDCERCGGMGHLDAMGGPAHHVTESTPCPDCARSPQDEDHEESHLGSAIAGTWPIPRPYTVGGVPLGEDHEAGIKVHHCEVEWCGAQWIGSRVRCPRGHEGRITSEQFSRCQSPVSDTEPEKMCEACGCRRSTPCDTIGCPIPVSGTEPDTAKLVEAVADWLSEDRRKTAIRCRYCGESELRDICPESDRGIFSCSPVRVPTETYREAFLAGFSVDAEKRQEESK